MRVMPWRTQCDFNDVPHGDGTFYECNRCHGGFCKGHMGWCEKCRDHQVCDKCASERERICDDCVCKC